MTDAPAPSALRIGTLASVIGIASTILVLTNVPAEESGRKVNVTVARDGTANVVHVAGPQYLKAYLDLTGLPTACDGLTGKEIRIGSTFTQSQCASMLESKLVAHAQGVMRCTPGLGLEVPRRDNARAAAVSLAFNVGVGKWCASTARRLINAGSIAPGCDAFLAWDKARIRGRLKSVPGLAARRQRERALCLKDA